MIDTDLERLPLSGWIVGGADGRFELLAEFEPGAVQAEIMIIRDHDDTAIDAVAWESDNPWEWWILRRVVAVVGEHELRAAWWEDRPARMLATPADYVSSLGAGFVILDFSADVDALIGAAPAIDCAYPWLEEKLWKTLRAQSMPKIRTMVGARGLHRAA